MNSYPTISVALATYNSSRTLKKTLASVARQEYPGAIEIIIADGGSTDETRAIASSYKARIMNVPTDKQNAEYNKGVAVHAAKHDVLLLIDHDNELPHKKWLQNMVTPLIQREKIFGAGVLRFNYKKDMTSLDRYFALFGAADPVAFFLNKSAHQSWLYDSFHLRAEVLQEYHSYFHVKLDARRMPALGGNGSVVWRKTLLENARTDPDHFFHIDVHVDLARKGFTDYAFVKDSITHYTNNSLMPFLSRRALYVDTYHFQDKKKRRYSVYDSMYDTPALGLYVIYTITLVGPLYHAVKGYLKLRDGAWFIHPLMCIAMLVIYGTSTASFVVKKYGTKK